MLSDVQDSEASAAAGLKLLTQLLGLETKFSGRLCLSVCLLKLLFSNEDFGATDLPIYSATKSPSKHFLYLSC